MTADCWGLTVDMLKSAVEGDLRARRGAGRILEAAAGCILHADRRLREETGHVEGVLRHHVQASLSVICPKR